MTTVIIITKGENKRPFCPEFRANNPMKKMQSRTVASAPGCDCFRYQLASKKNILVPKNWS